MSDTRDFRCSTPACKNYARAALWNKEIGMRKRVVCNSCAEVLIATGDWFASQREASKASRIEAANRTTARRSLEERHHVGKEHDGRNN